MDKDTKSSIKNGVIALLLMLAVFGTLYKCEVSHEEDHKAGKTHSH